MHKTSLQAKPADFNVQKVHKSALLGKSAQKPACRPSLRTAQKCTKCTIVRFCTLKSAQNQPAGIAYRLKVHKSALNCTFVHLGTKPAYRPSLQIAQKCITCTLVHFCALFLVWRLGRQAGFVHKVH